jgi:hypothetical protein
MQKRMDAKSSTTASMDSATTDSATMNSAGSEGTFVKKKSRQSRAVFNFWIDLLAFLTFLISTISGLALMRSPGGHGPELADVANVGLPNANLLWGLSRFEWQHLHTQISIICVVLIAVHLVMHWRWIASRLGRMVPSLP